MIIRQKAFVVALSGAARIAPTNAYAEIGACVLLSAKAGKLTIRATNLTIWATLEIECAGELSPVAVNAARVFETASQMRSDEIEIDVDGGRLILKDARKAKRSLPTLPVDGFQSLDPLKGEVSVGMDATKFRDGVEFARPFMSDDVAKPALCGLRVHSIKGAIRAVGASRTGMAYADIGSALAEFAVTLPPPFLDACLRSMPEEGPFFLSATDRAVECSWTGGAIRSPLIEGGFPEYEKAIPAATTGTLSVNADELVSAIKSARGLGHEDKGGGSTVVELRLNGSVEIVAKSDKGEASEPMDAEWAGEPLNIGLMSGQIAAGFAKLKSAPMSIAFGDAATPITFRADKFPDRLAVLSPVRI